MRGSLSKSIDWEYKKMKKRAMRRIWCMWTVLAFCASISMAGQKIENANGVRVVHNVKGDVWGAKPQVSLKLVRTYGDYDIEDEHLAFNQPSDAVLDAAGNLYVLDTGNQRIQKFGPDGKYVATIGRKGQGPGEFNSPSSLDIGPDGNFYVLETWRKLAHVIGPDGKELKLIRFLNDMVMSIRTTTSGGIVGRVYPGLRPLGEKRTDTAEFKALRVFDLEGKGGISCGNWIDYGDEMSTNTANIAAFDVDKKGNIYLTFNFQNRIEKCGPDGKLLWRADRPLNFKTEMIKKGKIEGYRYENPELNTVAGGIAADGKGRTWVITYLRQLKKEEQISTMMVGSVGGDVSTKVQGDQERPITDALTLEVFDPNGVLLGSLPLDFFVDQIRIVGDNLLLIDTARRSKVYHYKIVEAAR